MTGVVTVALALFVGFATVRLLLIVAPEILGAPTLARYNYRDEVVPTAGGVIVVLAVVAIAGARVGLGSDALGVAMAPVIGAFVATLPDDLGERLMLGDAGANVLGAVLGLAVVLECATGTRVVVLAVLLVLNAASEWVSFSRFIERVGV